MQKAPVGAFRINSDLLSVNTCHINCFRVVNLASCHFCKGISVEHLVVQAKNNHRAPDKDRFYFLECLFLDQILFDHLLESSHRDDSNKWSKIGFGQEITQVESIEVNFMDLIWSSAIIQLQRLTILFRFGYRKKIVGFNSKHPYPLSPFNRTNPQNMKIHIRGTPPYLKPPRENAWLSHSPFSLAY